MSSDQGTYKLTGFKPNERGKQWIEKNAEGPLDLEYDGSNITILHRKTGEVIETYLAPFAPKKENTLF